MNKDLQQWKIPSIMPGIVMLIISASFLLSVAIFLNINSQHYFYKEIRYDSVCEKKIDCSINFNVTEWLDPPIFISYQLTSFFQNSQEYQNSISYNQLEGRSYDKSECEPYVTNSQMNVTQNIYGDKLEEDEIAIPCGAIAKTYFNDSYIMIWKNKRTISIEDKFISLESDQIYLNNGLIIKMMNASSIGLEQLGFRSSENFGEEQTGLYNLENTKYKSKIVCKLEIKIFVDYNNQQGESKYFILHNNDELTDMKNDVFIAFISLAIVCSLTVPLLIKKFPQDRILMRKYKL